ncbi:MAG: serine/threonine protein kinase, partial [Myxococcales bacterium]
MPTSDATTGRTGDTSAPGVGELVAGKYRVEHVLGRGGMGVVLLAVHEQLEDRVALKVLLPEVARDQDVVDRFIHEARAAKSLRSENVVRVLDIGTLESGTPFMVMEFLEGEDLNALIERGGPLPVVDAVDHVLQAMVALAEAHASGLVHRDLKPANLFLTQRSDGSPLVKVLDFGISKRYQPDLVGGAKLAQTQRLMGSPLYMSPEQLRSVRLVDGRSDLWSLGVTLFELTTGRCPFEAESMSAVMISIANDPPMTFERLGVAVPDGFEAVVMRCLEKDPARRFASAAELSQALVPYA